MGCWFHQWILDGCRRICIKCGAENEDHHYSTFHHLRKCNGCGQVQQQTGDMNGVWWETTDQEDWPRFIAQVEADEAKERSRRMENIERAKVLEGKA